MYSPLVPFGYSPHHMGRHLEGAGTMTLQAETYRRIMNDVARSLIYHGFTKIVFVSHHGSNTKPIDELMRALRYQTGAFVAFYKTPTEREATVVQDLFDNPPEETPGWHSSELETSCLMATADELVDMDRAVEDRAHAPGVHGRLASPRSTAPGTVEVPGLGEHLGADGAPRVLRHRGDRQPVPGDQGEGPADVRPRWPATCATSCFEVRDFEVEVTHSDFKERAWSEAERLTARTGRAA